MAEVFDSDLKKHQNTMDDYECEHCGETFDYTNSEIVIDEWDNKKYYKCPHCDKLNQL